MLGWCNGEIGDPLGLVPLLAPALRRAIESGEPSEVEIGVDLGRLLKRVDLVREHRGRKITPDAPVPGIPPSRGSTTIDDQDGEALIGEPL